MTTTTRTWTAAIAVLASCLSFLTFAPAAHAAGKSTQGSAYAVTNYVSTSYNTQACDGAQAYQLVSATRRWSRTNSARAITITYHRGAVAYRCGGATFLEGVNVNDTPCWNCHGSAANWTPSYTDSSFSYPYLRPAADNSSGDLGVNVQTNVTGQGSFCVRNYMFSTNPAPDHYLGACT